MCKVQQAAEDPYQGWNSLQVVVEWIERLLLKR